MKALRYILLFIGLGLLAGAVFWQQSTQSFIGKAARAEGTVTDLVRSRSSDSTTYKPVVQFTSDRGERIEFISSVGSNPPSYAKGEKVEVLYLADNPRDAKINGFFSLWGGPLIVGGIGLALLLAGGGIVLVSRLIQRNHEHLKKYGVPVEAVFQSVALNNSISINGRHPFRVLAQWQNPSTSEVHIFESSNLWFDPSPYIKGGPRITVYLDRKNPKKYYVDLSFLPKLAN